MGQDYEELLEVSGSTPLLRFLHALAAVSLVALTYVCVHFIVRVALWTMLLAGIQGCGAIGTHRVLPPGHSLKVPRVDALLTPAQVVKLAAEGYRPPQLLIAVAVCHGHLAPSTACAELPVPTVPQPARPDPARTKLGTVRRDGTSDIDLRPEPLPRI